jgi:hypothetical protein
MEQLDIFCQWFVNALGWFPSRPILFLFSEDRTKGMAYLPSCPNFSEDGDRLPSPRISILNN